MKIQLGLRDQRSNYRPGEELAGAVLWESPEKPTLAEARLLWFTRGKGTEDGEVVATESFPDPQPGDTREFRFRLPEAPYSFNGKLISVTWAVEVMLQPGNHFERLTFTMGPNGEEVRLPLDPTGGTNFSAEGKK
jgi:hypothetical protein